MPPLSLPQEDQLLRRPWPASSCNGDMSRHPARCLICMNKPLTAPPRVFALQVLPTPRRTSPPHARSAARFRGWGPKERRGLVPRGAGGERGRPQLREPAAQSCLEGSALPLGSCLHRSLPVPGRSRTDTQERMLRALFIPSSHMTSQTPGHRAPRDTDPQHPEPPDPGLSRDAGTGTPSPLRGSWLSGAGCPTAGGTGTG